MSVRGKKAGKKTGSRPSTSLASTPVPVTAPRTPEVSPVMLTEGDPVEIEVSNRSYVSKVRAKEASRADSSSPLLYKKPVSRGSDLTASTSKPAGPWLMNRSVTYRPRISDETASPEPEAKRIESYRRSATEEEILNFISEARPKAKLTNFSPVREADSSRFSSPDRRRVPAQDLDRVLYLESKLKQSTEKCKLMERKYKSLLVKHVRSEEGCESPEGRESRLAEESTGIELEGSVESLLRKVLDELKDLKARMTRIESCTTRIESICGKEPSPS